MKTFKQLQEDLISEDLAQDASRAYGKMKKAENEGDQVMARFYAAQHQKLLNAHKALTRKPKFSMGSE